MQRILIVEDSPSFAAYTRQVLAMDHEVDIARNGIEAKKLIAARHYDLVITDIYMPDQDGLQTIRELRAEYPDLAVVAMSSGGLGNIDYLRVASVLGAVGTLNKPFTPAQLRGLVNSLLGRPEDYSVSIN